MSDSKKFPVALSVSPLEDAKALIAADVIKAAKEVFDVEIKDAKDIASVSSKVAIANPHSRKAGGADVAMPAFALARFIKGKKPNVIAKELGEKLNEGAKSSVIYEAVTVAGIYINFKLSIEFLGQVIDLVNNGGMMKAAKKTKEKVMIEYSQPNTHKAFHVGHMRNAALGDCLVRMYEFVGHEVVAANYFGDEGAHIAKCLWKLKRFVKEKNFDIETIAEKDRAEWLGGMYASAVSELNMGILTSLPFPDVTAAKVLSISDHPAEGAPKNWHVVELQTKPDEKLTVVCGGRGYEVGDFVAYKPVGTKLKNTEVIPKDMKGVTSSGVMLAYTELGQTEPADPPPKVEKKEEAKKEEKVEEKQPPTKGGKKGKKNKGGGGGKGGKKQKKKKKEKLPAKIYIVDSKKYPSVTPGVQLSELGKTDQKVENVMAEIKKRNTEVGDMLRSMEEGDKDAVALWEKTKKWSLDEFKRIYAWLNCRFDHDFFESEVSESSRKLVIDLHKKGVLQMSNGAICADLNKYKLGWLILLKSNGAGLYATKDLELARIKFEQFKVEKSLYIVDASQALHFQQVFKVLDLMGYEQAKKCTHLPYGMVILPSGKMSSRKGSVIFFNSLKKMLNEHLMKEYLSKYVNDPDWSKEEIEEAQRQLAVGTIKYGMLNHDVAKDLVFEMDKWSAKTGTTGPYSMYAYSRTKAIKRKVEESKKELGKIDYSILASQLERDILMHIAGFWPLILNCAEKNNPSGVCGYVFNLSKMFNSWYEGTHVLGSKTADELATRLAFSQCIGATVKACLSLLGITTLERM